MTLKRARTESIAKTMLLSVSGRKFEIATTTLRKMQWFEPLLAGRFSLEEVLFIDRDPDLFSVILQAVRSNRPPPREVVQRFGLFEIMETARYFCVDWLAEVLSGKLVHSAVPQKFANILAEEAVARKQLDDGHGCGIDRFSRGRAHD